MRRAIFTIVSNNYLPFARTLLSSAAEHHPDCDRLCVLVDTDASVAESFGAEFAVLHFADLGLPAPRRFAFRYSILELNTAVKPWAFVALFARGYDEVVYLDPDIRLYGPMRSVFERLADGADIVLTPHLLAPMTDRQRPTELDIRIAGTYNLGFCALARRPGAEAFLRWWQAKLVDRCRVDFAAGLFVDQSWVDLVPGLFDRVAILREPGYNVAYWNIAQRDLRHDDGRWTACGEPLVFFHFSGMDPLAPAGLSKHQDRFTLETLGPAAGLVRAYVALLRANGAAALGSLPYGFGRFDDGTPIPGFVRGAYRTDSELQALLGDDPFARVTVLTALVAPTRAGLRPITQAMRALWRTRADLRREFVLSEDASVRRYWHWFLAEAEALVGTIVARAHAELVATFDDGALQATADVLVPRGWYVDEDGIAALGAWVTPEATLPATMRAGAELVVEGHYEPQWIEQQTGSRDATLTVSLCETTVLSVVLQQPGRFIARATLPDQTGTGALVFRCSRHFVPRAIDLGDDTRILAWRALRITLDGHALLDSGRSPVIAGLDASDYVDGVNLVGYLAAESGVGESVRAFARACRAVDLPFNAFDVGYQNRNRQQETSLVAAPEDADRYGINVLHVNADQTGPTLAALTPFHRAAPTTIAYWHWEQPVLPRRFLPAFDGLTEVWVPSDFVHEAVATIAPIPVFKVPHAIEFEVPSSHDRAAFGLSDDRFCVLVMYDFDSSHYRKNPGAAIAAFRRACGSRRDTTLVVKTINADRDPDGYRELVGSVASLPDVRLIDRYLDRAAVHSLEHACDCLLSLHRAEGFGLVLAEMMYLGKPVVATGWSGNMEFMTPMNSFLVDYTLKPLEHATGAYEAGPVWAEADVEQAAHVLARLADDAALRRATGAHAAAHMRRYFSPSAIGGRYRQRLELVSRRRLR